MFQGPLSDHTQKAELCKFLFTFPVKKPKFMNSENLTAIILVIQKTD